jgi:hypothetical protein
MTDSERQLILRLLGVDITDEQASYKAQADLARMRNAYDQATRAIAAVEAFHRAKDAATTTIPETITTFLRSLE